MWILLPCLIAAYQIDTSNLVIITSELTPTLLISQFSQFQLQIKLTSNYQSALSLLPSNSILIDLTQQPGFIPILDILADQSQSVYITLAPHSDSAYSKRRIYAFNNETVQLAAINLMINWLNLTNFGILASTKPSSQKLSELIYSENKAKVSQFLSYDENIQIDVALNLVLRMIKSSGINQIVIVDQENSLLVIQNSIVLKRINDTGTVLLFTSSATGSIIIEGSLSLCETGTESSTSYWNYLFLLVFSRLTYANSILNVLSSVNDLTNMSVPQPATTYSVLNTKNSTNIVVGTVSNHFNQVASITYPGGASSPSNVNVKLLTLLISNGIEEIFDEYNYTLFSESYNGAVYAVAESNAIKELPNFEFTLRTANSGIFYYNATWYNAVLPLALYKPSPIAFLTGFWPDVAIGNSITLRSMNVFLPQISPYASTAVAEDASVFPDLLKMTASQVDFFLNGINFMLSLNWQSVVLIATDDSTFYPFYMAAVELLAARGMTIVNPADKRIFPWTYTRDDFETYKSYFEAAKNTSCRVYLVFVWDRGPIWEGLYDVGLRSGDFITVTDSASVSHLTGVAPEYLLKREAMIIGSFPLTYKEWNGPFGETLYTVFTKYYSQVTYVCMCYDTFTVVKEAVKYMLNIGEDYENSTKLMSYMRNNKVTGCMGSIYFQPGSTNLGAERYTIQQLLKYPNGTYYLKNIAYLDKLSAQFITYVGTPVWVTGTVPSNFIPIYDCPFEQWQIEDSVGGRNILYVICSFFFVLSCGCAVWSFKKFRNHYKPLTEKRLMSLSDRAFFFYFFFQFLQIMDMGPDQNAYKQVLNSLDLLLSLDFEKYYNVSHAQFWILFYSILSFTIIWVIISFVVLSKLNELYEDCWLCGEIVIFSDLILPLTANIGFLPMLSVLMNIFICNNSIGGSVSDSYMDRDCYTFCYTGGHRALAAIAFIVVFFHIVMTVYCRPMWEETQVSLAIRTRPEYLSVMSVVQVVLVVLNKCLKPQSQIAHGCVCLGILLVFMVYTIKSRPYNYPQAYVAQLLSISASLWGVFTATLFINYGSINTWIAVEFIGFLVIIIGSGILFSLQPKLLYDGKGNDISTLFIFQFCKNYEKYAKDLNSLHFTNVAIKYQINSSSEIENSKGQSRQN